MSKMKQRLLTVLKFSLYPLFYLTCLFVFFYLTFPWDRLSERIVAEFDKTQASKGAEAQRLEIGMVSGHWITGVEIENAKLIIPPSKEEIAAADLQARRAASGELDAETEAQEAAAAADAEAKAAAEGDDGTAKDEGEKKKSTKDAKEKKAKVDKGPKELIVLVERITARVQILPLLLGRVQVKFDVAAFGGEISGSLPVKGTGDVEVQLENVDLGQIPVLKKYITLPLRGVATGGLTLSRGEGGKLAKSTGSLSLAIEDAILGDGKSKLANLVTLPAAKLGKIEIAAEAEAGVLKVTKFGAAGGDLELSAEGQVKLKEKWRSSALDLYLTFKFSDEYRTKDDKTILLFGEPGSKIPGMIDAQPKIKRAKRGDDSYGLHVFGSLRAPKYEPWNGDEAGSGSKKRDAKTKADVADDDDDDDATSSTTTRKAPKPKTTRPPTGGSSKRTASDATDASPRNAPEPREVEPRAEPIEAPPMQEPEPLPDLIGEAIEQRAAQAQGEPVDEEPVAPPPEEEEAPPP